MNIEDSLHSLLREVAKIRRVWPHFLVALAIVAFAMWQVLEWHYGERITLLTAQRDDYKDKLGGASPDQAKARIDALETKVSELQRNAPRILSVPDQLAIRDELKPFGPLIATVGTTQPLRHAFDIDSLSAQIADVLSTAGWKPIESVWTDDNRPVGISVSAREGDGHAADAADILVKRLNAAGIAASRDSKPFAGPKPPQPPAPKPLPSGPDVSENAIRSAMTLNNSLGMQLQTWRSMPDVQVVIGTKP